MKKSFALIFNLAYWACYGMLFLMMFTVAIQAHGSPQWSLMQRVLTGLILIPSLSSFYLMYALIFPRYLNRGQWVKGILSSLASIFVSSLLGFTSLFVLLGTNDWNSDNWSTKIGIFLLLLFISFVNSIMGWVIQGFVTWFNDFRLKAELKDQNHAMQLALIQSKMDPHFLFNSLNNIDVLIQNDPEKGSLYLNKLSDVIRFMLYETQVDRISLSKEIDHLKRYIDLQKIRSSNEDFVQFQVSGDIDQKKVAPVVFIPFVENAFKHCPNKKEAAAIAINLEISDQEIRFTCSNSKGKVGNEQNLPLGNQLIRERLALLYPGTHELHIQNDDQKYTVTLSLDA